MELVDSPTGGPLLFCGFVLYTCAWWSLFPIVESIVQRINPALYEYLNREHRNKKLIPMIIMSMRLCLGFSITLPSCTYAALTTPWGLGQPLSAAGKICVGSQVTMWAAELGPVSSYSTELFVHHIICLLVTANVVMSPPIHQIKPLYIFFASQLGDLGTGMITVMKMSGMRPHSSTFMYGVVLSWTCWIVCSKVGTGLWSIGNALQTPYRMGDWVWTFCLLFWAFYSLFVAYRNLKWLKVIKKNPLRPYSIVCAHRVSVPLSHLVLGAAFSTALLSTFFVYGLYHTQALTPSDLTKLCFLGLLGVALGLTSAMGMRVVFPVKASQTDPWGRDLYLHYGMLIVAWWVYYGGGGSTSKDGRTTIMGALALNVPLFQALAKVSYYVSARDAATHFLPPDPEEEDEKPIPVAPAMARLDKKVVQGHLGMARANLTIFLITVSLLACDVLNLSEAGILAVGASLVSQLVRSPGMIYDSLNDSTVATFLHALLTSVGVVLELSILVYEIAARQLRGDNASYSEIVSDYALIGGVVAAGFASEFLFVRERRTSSKAPSAASKVATDVSETAIDRAKVASDDSKTVDTTSTTTTPDVPHKKKGSSFFRPMTFSILSVSLAQVLVAREVLRYSGPMELKDPGVGFVNFRDLLTSGTVWAVVAAAGFMPMLLLKAMDIASARAYGYALLEPGQVELET
ncbi:hypothetical protein AK830_g11998 [Neonectria ditissima]|uniref:Uncharacterized protein n=1 Tax=Neonectria ditissima TaxID=78410 RepID=A0A0P7AKW0_9HYPO|nr:hypothetical protein AK830_g11998 [Neonectria ditissima]